MKTKKVSKKTPKKTKSKKENFSYPAEQDIYSNEERLVNINPDDYSEITEGNKKDNERNEKDFKDDHTGDDLDVPGSELDDEEEDGGREDEENNYYSLGDNK